MNFFKLCEKLNLDMLITIQYLKNGVSQLVLSYKHSKLNLNVFAMVFGMVTCNVKKIILFTIDWAFV